MKELTCSVVCDLLPNYAEGLTSEETNKFIEIHFASCDECRKLYESYKSEVQIPVEKPDKIDRKIINGMRFKFLWYMFWPMFYGATLQFQKAGSLRLMIMVLVVTAFALIYSHVAEYSFDLDDSKKEFYERENKNINSGKGSFLTQGLFWILPILVPVLFRLIPILISWM